MKKTMLIAGRDTPFGAALVTEARSRGFSVIATVEPERGPAGASDRGRETAREAPPSGESDDLIVLPWNRASAFSARNIIVRCRNTNRPLAAALIPFSADPADPADPSNPGDPMGRVLESLEPSAVDEYVDREIKGRLFLAREAASEFARQGSGILAFVEHGSGTEGEGLGALAAGAFRALAQGMFSRNLNSPYLTQGYCCPYPMDAAFAAFIFRTLEEADRRTSGRWIKFTGKQGILANLRTLGRD
jgi:hypothetical protein